MPSQVDIILIILYEKFSSPIHLELDQAIDQARPNKEDTYRQPFFTFLFQNFEFTLGFSLHMIEINNFVSVVNQGHSKVRQAQLTACTVLRVRQKEPYTNYSQ